MRVTTREFYDADWVEPEPRPYDWEHEPDPGPITLEAEWKPISKQAWFLIFLGCVYALALLVAVLVKFL
jgi:hypothetical protein